MHRNTYILVAILAVFAALVVGINVGKKQPAPAPTPAPIATPAATPTPQLTRTPWANEACGVSLYYPDTYQLMENASGSGILKHPENTAQSIVVTCQPDIPRPALTDDRIETLSLPRASGASVSATLYHDASAKDGTPIDALIFHHPTNGMDVFIAGFGEAFNTILTTIQVLP